jgi:hypothetical protein
MQCKVLNFTNCHIVELDTLLAADMFPSPATDLIDAIDQKLAALIEEVQNAKVYLAPYDQRAYASV